MQPASGRNDIGMNSHSFDTKSTNRSFGAKNNNEDPTKQQQDITRSNIFSASNQIS